VQPSQGGQLYLKAKSTDSTDIFIKTIDSSQLPRLTKALELESKLSNCCSEVVRPVTSQPLALPGTTRHVLIWPFVVGTTLDIRDTIQLRNSGRALASLHNALWAHASPNNQSLKRKTWLSEQTRELLDAQTDGLLNQFTQRFDWLSDFLINLNSENVAAFFMDEAQVIHGDLNPGNILCTKHGQILFLDFEEAVNSFYPVWLDLAIFIERHFMVPERPLSECVPFIEGYREVNGTLQFPRPTCLADALTFATLRSIIILISSERVGRKWAGSEWKKFGILTKLANQYRVGLIELAENFS
jgi:hypothetical protein